MRPQSARVMRPSALRFLPADLSNSNDRRSYRRNVMMKCRMLIALLVLVASKPIFAQEGFPLFTTDFPPEEFAQRRAAVYGAIGESGLAIVQGAAAPAGYTRFRQSNEMYYLCGIESPHAYLLLDGGARRSSLYLPHRNEGRERKQGN